jgi:hypothetical protein
VIAQKVVPGTVYTNANVQSKSFVYHQLEVGSDYNMEIWGGDCRLCWYNNRYQ